MSYSPIVEEEASNLFRYASKIFYLDSSYLVQQHQAARYHMSLEA
jgi:hypothetical protein